MGGLGFYVFGHFVAYYGLMIVIGLLTSSFFAYIQMKRFGLVMNDFIILCSICGLSGIIGAKILYLVVSYQSIDMSRLTEPSYISSLMSGGFVFLGGVFAILPSLLFCKKKLHISIQPYIQSCIGCLPIGHAFGRIGCFLVGCCYGCPFDSPFSVTYTQSSFAPNGIPLFPVQLVEAFIEFAIGICLIIFSKKLHRSNGIYLYLLTYSISRFFLEFMRYDEARGSLAGLSTSQFLCVLLCLAALFFFIRNRRQTT